MQQTQLRDQYLKTIVRSGLLQGVPANSYKSVFRDLGIMIKEYTEGEVIFSEEEEIKRLAVVHKGSVKGEKFYLEGDVHLMHIYQEGEIFAIEAATSRTQTAPLTYIANDKTVVLLVSLIRMENSPHAKELMKGMMNLLADDNIKKLYKIETLAKRGLRERIMVHLKIMRRKAGAETFSIHMNREQFAQYLCVNRSALSYELNEMKREGLIDFKKDTFRLIEKVSKNVGEPTIK